MGYIPNIISSSTVTFFLNGVPYQVDKSFPGFQTVLDELKSASPNEEVLIAATNPAKVIAEAVSRAEAVVDTDSMNYLPRGVVSVTRSEVRYNGEAVTGVLIDRILSLLSEGFDIMPMIRFLENLYMNPADFAREELYLWLEGSSLPITEDGCFLAYKNVNGDFTSIHDGCTDNTPGTIVKMPRQSVDPVRDRTCSRGLHFCSKSYLPNFSSGRNNKVILLKINPADVVSIPSDYNNAKGRAWRYEVLSVVGDDPQTKVWPSVVAPNGDIFTPPTNEDKRLVANSSLAKTLFAACNSIGLTDRDDRLDWAFMTLVNGEYLNDDDSLESFNDLTQLQAGVLLEVAQDQKAHEDTRRQKDVAANIKKSKIAAINSYGIVTLRKEASKAGLVNAWKGHNGFILRKYLIDCVE